MANARMLPPSGPFVVQTSTPASARDSPPSQTSADSTSAVPSLDAIVFAPIDFMGASMHVSTSRVRVRTGTTSRSGDERFVLGCD